MIDFKTLALSAAVIAAPMFASAATVNLVENGSVTVAIDDEIFYAGAELDSGAGSLTFTIEAVPPSQLELEAALTTLEFFGAFEGLQISLGSSSGSLVGVTANSTQYEVSSVFNPTNGYSQDLVITWTGVQGAGAGILIQGIAAAVPVPAAGLMLLTALGAAGALRRRKKATA